MMKGYLNGGVFKKRFIDDWHANPDWKAKEQTALRELVDFKEYCERHKQQYISLRDKQAILDTQEKGLLEEVEAKIGDGLGLVERESATLRKFTGFNNSFRIIVKQNSVRKEGKVFVIDADFDVDFTIDPSPVYRAALEEHMRKHGTLPSSYVNLENTYREFCVLIHDRMVNLPMCRKYFAMLGVINFFAGYFSTLKRHRKIPVLPAMEAAAVVKGSPPLFPYLPIRSTVKEKLMHNFHVLLITIFKNHRATIEAYFNQVRLDLTKLPAPRAISQREALLKVFQTELTNQVIQKGSRALQKKIRDSKDVQEMIGELAEIMVSSLQKELADLFNTARTQFTDMLPKMFGEEEMVRIISGVINGNRARLATYFGDLYKAIALSQPTETSDDWLSGLVADQATREFSHLTRSRAKGVGDKVVESIKGKFNRAVSYGGFSTIFQQGSKDEWKPAGTVTFSQIRIRTEIGPVEIETGEKVVGGCGMRMQKQVVQADSTAREILLRYSAGLRQLAPETWSEVDLGPDRKGFVFRLVHEDVPAWLHDDYGWMESLLFVPKGADADLIQERIFIEEAMKGAHKQAFDKLLSNSAKLSQMKDRDHRTLMHHAACLEDEHYVSALHAKGLSISDRDINGYQPVHYASMAGALKTLKWLVNKGGAHLVNERLKTV